MKRIFVLTFEMDVYFANALIGLSFWLIEGFYLTRETDANIYYKIATNNCKQKKRMELVHNST